MRGRARRCGLRPCVCALVLLAACSAHRRESQPWPFASQWQGGAAPARGEFEVFLTTGYVFADDDGNDVADNEKALMDHMLYVLACEMVR